MQLENVEVHVVNGYKGQDTNVIDEGDSNASTTVAAQTSAPTAAPTTVAVQTSAPISTPTTAVAETSAPTLAPTVTAGGAGFVRK